MMKWCWTRRGVDCYNFIHVLGDTTALPTPIIPHKNHIQSNDNTVKTFKLYEPKRYFKVPNEE